MFLTGFLLPVGKHKEPRQHERNPWTCFQAQARPRRRRRAGPRRCRRRPSQRPPATATGRKTSAVRSSSRLDLEPAREGRPRQWAGLRRSGERAGQRFRRRHHVSRDHTASCRRISSPARRWRRSPTRRGQVVGQLIAAWWRRGAEIAARGHRGRADAGAGADRANRGGASPAWSTGRCPRVRSPRPPLRPSGRARRRLAAPPRISGSRRRRARTDVQSGKRSRRSPTRRAASRRSADRRTGGGGEDGDAAAGTAGKLTPARPSQVRADLQTRVTDMVNGTRPAGGPGGGSGGPPPSGSTGTTSGFWGGPNA